MVFGYEGDFNTKNMVFRVYCHHCPGLWDPHVILFSLCWSCWSTPCRPSRRSCRRSSPRADGHPTRCNALLADLSLVRVCCRKECGVAGPIGVSPWSTQAGGPWGRRNRRASTAHPVMQRGASCHHRHLPQRGAVTTVACGRVSPSSHLSVSRAAPRLVVLTPLPVRPRAWRR